VTGAEREKLNNIVDLTNYLLDGKGNGITNMDVIEAVLGDLGRVLTGRSIRDLNDLIQRDTVAQLEMRGV
jgi:hypothetical protein